MEPIAIRPAELGVDIGLPTGTLNPWQFTMSLAATVKACTQRNVNVEVACIAGSSVVTWARDKVLDMFLNGKSNYLFWIDSDIRWQPEDFLRLLVLASKYQVVCGAYAQKTEGQDIVIHRHDLTHFEINPHGLLRIQGTGLGFTVLAREVVERIAETKPWVYDPVEGRSIRNVFRLDTVDRGHEHPHVRHEDTAFFADLEELGFPVWLDPTIKLGHVGQKEYKSDPLAALRLDAVFKQEAA